MRAKRYFLSLLAILAYSTIYAYDYMDPKYYDFDVNGIYYTITSNTGHTVAVTYGLRGSIDSNEEDEFTDNNGIIQYYYGDGGEYEYYIINIFLTGSYVQQYAYSGSLSIPSSVTYNEINYQVTAIDSHAFENCSGITSIIIPNSVTSIGARAFKGCSGLTSVTIGSTTPPSIYSDTFVGLGSTAILYVPSGSKVAYEADNNWKSAFKEIVEFPIITFADANVKTICLANWDTNGDGQLSEAEAAAVTTLGDAFYGNNSITSFDELQYFTGLSSIVASAFSGCTSLTSVIIPNNVKLIGGSAFSRCRMSSITIPYGVTSIGGYAFYGCTLLALVTIPNSVLTIGNCSFRDCSSLYSLTIPNSVTSIGEQAFDGCHLTAVRIPSSVTTIGTNAFYNCGYLTSVIVEKETPISIAQYTFSNRKNATLYVPAGSKAAYEAADGWTDFGEIVELSNEMADIDENVYYLRNVETGKYLSNGNAWGMHAVLADAEEAIPVHIYKRNGYYHLYCAERSQNQQLIFRDDETNVFVDYNGQDYASPYWSFIAQGKDIYYIQSEPGNPVYGQEAMPGTCLGNNPDDGTDVNGNVSMSEHRNNVLWQLELARKTGAQHERLKELANRLEPLGVNVDWAREILKWNEADYFDAMREIDRLEKEIGRIDQLKDELRNMIASAGKIGVNTDEASSVADNDDSTIDGIRQAITTLRSAFIAKLGEGIDENLIPLDVTGVIVNPSFTYDNAEGWEGDEPQFQPEHFCNNAEFWSRSFDFHQTISGLPNGQYFLELQRFRRGVDDEHVHYYANGELGNVTDVYEEALDWKLSEGWTDNSYSDFLEFDSDGTTKYIPNSMTGARVAFDFGQYGSWLPFEVTDGTATIGIKVDTEEGERWVCFDNFRLHYYGDEPAHPFANSDISAMDDAIYIEPFNVHIGRDINIDVKLKNAWTASSYSFNLVLPEGITIADDGNGGFKKAITLSSRNSQHTVMTNKIADNIYRIGVTSLSGKSLTGFDGTVLTIKAHVGDNFSVWGDRIVIRSPQIIYSNDKKPEVQKTVTRVDVIWYPKGDANGDDVVDMADVQVIIKHNVGKKVATFIDWVADVDGDGEADLADAILVLNYHMGRIGSLSRETGEALSRVMRVSARNALLAPDFQLSPEGGNIILNLALDAADVYAGYQFKVETPDGLSYVVDSENDVELGLGEGHTDHEAIAHWNADESVLAVNVASLGLTPFNGTSLSLQIPLAATSMETGSTADFNITGISLVKHTGEKVKLGDVSFKVTIGEPAGDPTGISVVKRETDGNYYNLKGQHVAKPGKGVYIYKGRKVMR